MTGLVFWATPYYLEADLEQISRMKASIYRSKGIAARLPMLLAVWMLIAVALFSALAPVGPPLSRVTGSAFNPATSDVVLKARAPLAPQAAQAARPDRDGDPVIALLLPALAALPIALCHILSLTGAVKFRPRRQSHLRRTPNQPRAPPALS